MSENLLTQLLDRRDRHAADQFEQEEFEGEVGQSDEVLPEVGCEVLLVVEVADPLDPCIAALGPFRHKVEKIRTFVESEEFPQKEALEALRGYQSQQLSQQISDWDLKSVDGDEDVQN